MERFAGSQQLVSRWSFKFMKKLKMALLMAAMAAALNVGSVQAQGNFDPAEMRARMMERVRETLEVKDDAEWKIVSERVEKVMAAQREARSGGGGFAFGGRGGGRRNADGGGDANGGGRRRGGAGGGMFGAAEPSQEAKDLQAAIEAKAPAEEIKTKLEKFRAYRKTKEAELKTAQDKLKEVLNAKQEAAAVLAGYLN
jgi:hypothetical protein